MAMRYTESRHAVPRRRAVILLVVLAMLTLFALLGIAFVTYAEAAANEARLAREGEQMTRADLDPQVIFSMFLGQLVYDLPDPVTSNWTTTSWGAFSALRGHGLARNMYGWNPSGINDRPYCSPGRLNEAASITSGWPSPFTSYATTSFLINYTPYINAAIPDGGLRDPEHLGYRASFGTAPATSTYLACNVPYTYPDQQNMFLAAIKADGTLLTPSYHRSWIFDPTNPTISLTDQTNANWTNAIGKYLLLRPRPCDMALSTTLGAAITLIQTSFTVASSAGISPGDTLQIDSEQLQVTGVSGTALTVVRGVNGTTAAGHASGANVYDIRFPYPDENGGDVKNLAGFPGGNDSVWIDIDAPVQIAPDGTKYKMLVAPLILDLDNRINIATAGNILATTNTSASNQGWGPWEVNPSKILNCTAATSEWTNFFTGVKDSSGTTRVAGKYGMNGVPSGASVVGSDPPAGYAQTDYNAIQDSTPSVTTTLGGGGITSTTQTTITVASSTGINNYDVLQIDSEQLQVTSIAGTTLTVVRAVNGTIAAAHSSGATVYDLPYRGALSTNFQLPGTSLGAGNNVQWQCFPLFPSNSYNNGNQTYSAGPPTNVVETVNHPLSYNVMRAKSTTTLNGAVSAAQITITVFSSAQINVNDIVQIDSEQLQVTLISGTTMTTLTVTRGVNGTTAATHSSGAAVRDITSNTGDDRVLSASHMPAVLLFGGTNTDSYFSDILRLLPNNLGYTTTVVANTGWTTQFRARNLITVSSFDLDRPGVLPYAYNDTNPLATDNYVLGTTLSGAITATQTSITVASAAGINTSFPIQIDSEQLLVTAGGGTTTLTVTRGLNGTTAATHNSGVYVYDIRFCPSATALSFPLSTSINAGLGEFDPGARSLLAALGRIDLNRPLTDYPFVTDPNFNGTGITRRFDTTNPAVMAQVNQANADRQQFATDIFNRLLTATGSQYTQNAYACQWLAQLAVNIVDYIDTDDVSTIFTYTVPGTGITGTVYGTEVPKLVLNETYVQWDNTPTDVGNGTLTGGGSNNVNVYVEIVNTMPQMPGNSELGPPVGADGYVMLQTDYGPVYQLVLNDLANATAITGGTSQLRAFTNTKGDPDTGTGVYGNATTAPFQPFGPTTLNPTGQGWGASGTVASGSTPGSDQFVGPATQGSQFSMPPNPAGSSSSTGWYVIGPNTTPGVVYLGTASPPMDPSLSQTDTPQANAVAMTYTVPNTATNLPAPTILLRRLANPYLPNNETVTGGMTPYNPYITVDYMQTSQSIPWPPPPTTPTGTVSVTQDDRRINATGGAQVPPAVGSRMSWGRRQPYAGLSTSTNTQLRPQIPPSNTNPWGTSVALNTFFGQNTPDGTSATGSTTSDTFQVPFDWLAHLDRQLISPMELLHVSGFKPHELTQQFVQVNPNATVGTNPAQAVMPNQHAARWTDPSTRLSRALETLGTRCRSNGVALGGRVPGRVNINTIFDVETLRALCDAQPANMFYAQGGSYTTTDDAVNNIFNSMMAVKTPNWNPTAPTLPSIGATDRPFLGMAVGAGPGTSDELPYNVVATRGVDYTLFAANTPPTTPTNAWPSSQVTGVSSGVLLLEPNNGTSPVTPNSPSAGNTMNIFNFPQVPYQRAELLRKAFNNLTTRSNVYGVWLTVGYFQVLNDTVRPIQLGAEIGKSENRQIRHHMFAIVDRSNLQIWPTIDPNATTPGTAMVRASAAITLPTQSNNDGPGGSGPATVLAATYTSAAISLINSSGAAITSVTNPYTNFAWTLAAGNVLTYDPDTDNEETVVVQGTTGSFTATFFKNHLAGCTVISRGNPGPWLRYDPRNDTGVVPYFAVID
jgi:hypothetical protein